MAKEKINTAPRQLQYEIGGYPQLLTYDVHFRYFSVKQGYRLRRGKIKSVKVYNDMACIQHCSRMADSCTSVNFNIRRTNGLHLCELISSKVQGNREVLESDGTFNFISLELPIYKNCDGIYKRGGKTSGVYSISPSPSHSVQVYCDMVTSGGGWTVIQKRLDGSVDFYRDWSEYKRGFGNKVGEYWLGLDNMHMMTSQRNYQLRVDMEDFEGNTRYAEYGLFDVADETDNYRLSLGIYSGDGSDSMSVHSGMEFSTKDRDNDKDNTKSCAATFKGAWWFNNCLSCNPNGLYLKCKNICPSYEGVVWNGWHGGDYSLKRIEIKIRANS